MKGIAAAITCGIVAIAGLPASTTTASAATPTVWLNSVLAERGAIVCPRECTPANVHPPKYVPGDVKHVCFGTSLANTSAAYRCEVFVGGVVSGRAPKGVPVFVTFTVTSDDGSPWGDDVRRVIRSRSELTEPPAAGAPSPCSVVTSPDQRVSCVKVGPKTWRATATTSTKTGLFVVALGVGFPASTSTKFECEFLQISGAAKIEGKTTTIRRPRRAYCA